LRVRLQRSRRIAALDRGKSTIGKLILALGMAGVLAGAVPAPALPPTLDEWRWTAPGAEIEAVTEQPASCLAFAPAAAGEVGLGRALFNSPSLLGGQAAKAGLNCASCHVNGRGNPHFFLNRISDQPGTADVTASFFGPARGNGRFDPVVIPDLAVPGKIARDPPSGALEPFIRTLIVDEFSGAEPGAAVLSAVAAYVRAVRPCQTGASTVARTLGDQLDMVRSAVTGAAAMARRGEDHVARQALAAARHQLGLIHQRYAGPGLAGERRQLLGASRALQRLGDQTGEPAAFAEAARRWLATFDAGLAANLRKKEARSLYNPRNLHWPQNNR
jgi:hypothetical protein